MQMHHALTKVDRRLREPPSMFRLDSPTSAQPPNAPVTLHARLPMPCAIDSVLKSDGKVRTCFLTFNAFNVSIDSTSPTKAMRTDCSTICPASEDDRAEVEGNETLGRLPLMAAVSLTVRVGWLMAARKMPCSTAEPMTAASRTGGTQRMKRSGILCANSMMNMARSA